MSSVMPRPGRLQQVGHWMQRHGSAIRMIQWVVVAVYAFLIVVPAVMPLPDGSAHLWSNLTLAAQFVFWGIWWPFVLLSMVKTMIETVPQMPLILQENFTTRLPSGCCWCFIRWPPASGRSGSG